MSPRSNKHYLSLLQEPCELLRKSGPAEIPGMLQDVLNRIRVIWNNSPFYNTRWVGRIVVPLCSARYIFCLGI